MKKGLYVADRQNLEKGFIVVAVVVEGQHVYISMDTAQGKRDVRMMCSIMKLLFFMHVS